MRAAGVEGVSVIIPAFNAEATIGATLASLQAQTLQSWEAIVIDDGSTDDTLRVAGQASRHDRRIRVFHQSNAGLSATRNTAVARATFEWLCFLDADDVVLPEYLQRLTEALRRTPGSTAAYCGSARLLVDGARAWEREADATGDLYPLLASHVVFPVHACLLSRDLFHAAGGFDAAFEPTEDWDFWLRVARAGGRFAVARQTLALYRVRPGSASMNGRRLLAAGFRVLEVAHRPDSRVGKPSPAWAAGDPSGLLSRQYHFLGWCAGLELAAGRDARPLLESIPAEPCPDIDPQAMADGLFRAVLLARGLAPTDWSAVWPKVGTQIESFFAAAEARSRAPWLQSRSLGHLRRVAGRHATRSSGRMGKTQLWEIDVAEPFVDLELADDVERICCRVRWEEAELGLVELPVFECVVPGQVIRDVIAAEHGARLLEIFLCETVYPALRMDDRAEGRAVLRGSTVLAEGLQHETLHSRVGWTVFLQELWGKSEWPLGWFYDPGAPVDSASPTENDARPGTSVETSVEVARDLPSLVLGGGARRVTIALGGVAIGALDLPPGRDRVATQELRSAITRAGGFELARAAVREGLLGHPRRASTCLRQRLRAAADSAARLETDRAAGILIGHRRPTDIDTSQSRWARLPCREAEPLLALARAGGELVITHRGSSSAILYCPARIPKDLDRSATVRSTKQASLSRPVGPYHDRAHFEGLFAGKVDPYGYTDPYEQAKYGQALDLLPSPRFQRALELACAEGVFTRELAPRVDELIAADISQTALERAAKRCRDWPGVRFRRLDLRCDPLPRQLDLIVCSEVLYFLSGEDELRRVAERMASALAAGGYLLMTHSNVVVDDPDQPGFDWNFPYGAKRIGEVFAETASLDCVRELRSPLYRIQLFRKCSEPGDGDAGGQPAAVELIELPAPVPERVASTVRWGAGPLRRKARQREAVTWRLPILMYHRIGERGDRCDDRYLVSPGRLEEQLRYLRECGYYDVGLEEWRQAMAVHEPLPGRAILITFDDGYEDFESAAWPLLQRYGFGALLFVVAGAVGGTGEWEGNENDRQPLLDWEALRRLRAQGLAVGSHSLTHPALTTLSPTAVVHELARARELLESNLEIRVDALAFPYGQHDAVTRHLAAASGHIYGLTTQSGLTGLWSDLLTLPRLEVRDTDGMRELAFKLRGTDAPA